MKHLCGRFQFQSFVWAVIQSVFNHLNFFVCNACHLALLGHVLPQQAVEVLGAASLSTGKGPGKVARAAQRFINRGMPPEFFAVVIGLRLDPGFKRLERFDNRRANQISCFV